MRRRPRPDRFEAFVGLPLGQLGDFGAALRSESLAFTDGFPDATFGAGDPLTVSPRLCYLNPVGPVAWTPECPTESVGCGRN
jgi:hypothetical protein